MLMWCGWLWHLLLDLQRYKNWTVTCSTWCTRTTQSLSRLRRQLERWVSGEGNFISACLPALCMCVCVCVKTIRVVPQSESQFSFPLTLFCPLSPLLPLFFPYFILSSPLFSFSIFPSPPPPFSFSVFHFPLPSFLFPPLSPLLPFPFLSLFPFSLPLFPHFSSLPSPAFSLFPLFR